MSCFDRDQGSSSSAVPLINAKLMAEKKATIKVFFPDFFITVNCVLRPIAASAMVIKKWEQ